MKAMNFAGCGVLAFALTITLVWGASGTAASQTVDKIANLTGPDRQKILEKGAKKEGKLLWMGTFNEKNSRKVLAEFTVRYPYIKVKRIRTGSSQVLQRVLAELRAKAPKTDLITSYAGRQFRAANAIQAFKSPILDVYPAADKDPTGMSAPLYIQYFGMAAYNTNGVPEADAPKTYDDLLNPKWKGQMVWSNTGSSGAPFFITFLRLHWGEAKAMAYLKKLAKQKIITRTGSGRTVLGMTSVGEYKIMLVPFLTHIGQAVKKRAPVGVVMQDPVPGMATPFMLSRMAPHPHATMMLVDYLLGKHAQTVLKKAGYFPAHPAVTPADAMKPFSPKAKGYSHYLVDSAVASKMLPETTKIFSKLFE
jgi:ABC-type Fe3+ transport system substrate-binding protein